MAKAKKVKQKGKVRKLEPVKSNSKRKQVEAELNRLHDENGSLTPRLIVDTARNQDSILHPYFEWDDGVAAEAFRLSQARNLVRSFHVAYETTTERIECHAYIRDPEIDKHVQGYRHINQIKADESSKLQTIESELLRAKSILSRVRDISLTLDIQLGLEKFIDELGRLSVEVIESRRAA